MIGIYGQNAVTEIFEKMITSNNIPHALLFTGIEGIGKELAAIKFTAAVNGVDTNKDNRINKIVNSFSEPYVKYIYPLPRGKN